MEYPKPLTLALSPDQAQTHKLVRLYYKAQAGQPTSPLEEEWMARLSDDVRDGIRRAFYPDGSLWCEELWKDGSLWESITDLMPDGTPVPGHKIKDGTGHQKTYDERGNLIEEGDFVLGKRHGPFWFFYPNGALSLEAYYQEGKRAGLWRRFTEAGIVASTEDYNATPPYKKRFQKDGSLADEGPIVEGKDGSWRQDGLWRFHTKGKPTQIKSYTPGDDASYLDPFSLFQIGIQHPTIEHQVKAMLKACEEPPACATEKSIQNLLTSMRRYLEAGNQLPLEMALLFCELAKYYYQSGTLGALAILKTYGAEILPEIERRSQGARSADAIIYVLAIQQILGEEPLSNKHRDLLWRAIRFAEYWWHSTKIKELLRAVLYRLPFTERELLLRGPSGQEFFFFVAPTCLSEAVLQETLSLLQKLPPSALGHRKEHAKETLEGFQGKASKQIINAIKSNPRKERGEFLLQILLASKHPDTLPYLKEVLLGRTRTDKTLIKEALPGYGDVALPLLEDLIATTKGALQGEVIEVLSKLAKTSALKAAAARLVALRTIPEKVKSPLRTLALQR